MATQLNPHARNNRMVVLVSNDEKRRIEEGARASDMSLSDFVRTATQNYAEPSETEAALIRDLLSRIEASEGRIETALAALEATNARADAFNEEAYKADLRNQWTTQAGEPDWDAIQASFDKRLAFA